MVSGRRFKGERARTTACHRDGQPVNGHFFGQSSFATHSITTADALVKVPDGVPVELLGPLACGVGTGAGAVLNEARPRFGDSVLIAGVGAVDLAFDCTGVIAVIETLAQTVGMLGALVLVGGAPAGASFSLDRVTTLWGKRVIGVLGGAGRSGQLIPALVALYQQDSFPFDRLVRYDEMSEIEQAVADSKSGEVVKPILRVPR